MNIYYFNTFCFSTQTRLLPNQIKINLELFVSTFHHVERRRPHILWMQRNNEQARVCACKSDKCLLWPETMSSGDGTGMGTGTGLGVTEIGSLCG